MVYNFNFQPINSYNQAIHMKYKLILLVFIVLATQMYGQKIDTLSTSKKLSYKAFIIPTAMITAGVILLNTDDNQELQDKSNNFFGKNFHSTADNIFPLVPIAQIYTGRYLGFEPKNNFKHQTIDLVVANATSLIIVEILKNSIKKERPDQSDNLSFPSGHSAIAFTNAALLFNEYKDSNIWYASSGFLFATTTAIFRIANNKHYSSDVLTGAGIGLASGILVSYYNPFQSMRFGKTKKTTAFIYPQIGNQIGLGLLIKPNY